MQLTPLSQVIAESSLPIFGVVDGYRELKQMGYGYGDSVHLNFSAGPVSDPILGLSLETKQVDRGLGDDVRVAARQFEMRLRGMMTAFAFGPQWYREQEVRKGRPLDPVNPLPEYSSEFLTVENLMVGNIPVVPEVWRCQAETLVHALVAENDAYQVFACTSGFETAELGDVLTHIGQINDEPDLWERYAQETQERLRELGHLS